MYKFSELTEELSRKNKLITSNHLFLFFFIVIVVFIGGISIWFVPVFNTVPFDIFEVVKKICANLTAFNLMAFSIPLLSVLMLDNSFSLFLSYKENGSEILNNSSIWLAISFFVCLIFITILFGVGRNDVDFSLASFIAWLLTLYIWLVSNVEERKYQAPTSSGSPSGGDLNSSAALMRGQK